MQQKNRKYWPYSLLAIALIFFVFKKFIKQENAIEVKAFKVQNGWGYDVYRNNKVYIHQTIIPAIEGRKEFVSQEQAIIIGNLVAKKLNQGKGGGLPQITVEELDSLKITK